MVADLSNREAGGLWVPARLRKFSETNNLNTNQRTIINMFYEKRYTHFRNTEQAKIACNKVCPQYSLNWSGVYYNTRRGGGEGLGMCHCV